MFKSLPGVAVQIARLGILAALLATAVDASAQAYSPAGFEPVGQATPQQFGLSSAAVHALGRDNEMTLLALDGIRVKPRTAGRVHAADRSGPWTIYGRLGILSVQNQLSGDSAGMQFGLRAAGPTLGSKIHIGLLRRF